MVLDMKVNGSEFIKTAEITKWYTKHHRRPSMMQSLVVIHHSSSQSGGISPSHTSLHALPGNNI
jgi:hypothetical protein